MVFNLLDPEQRFSFKTNDLDKILRLFKKLRETYYYSVLKPYE